MFAPVGADGIDAPFFWCWHCPVVGLQCFLLSGVIRRHGCWFGSSAGCGSSCCTAPRLHCGCFFVWAWLCFLLTPGCSRCGHSISNCSISDLSKRRARADLARLLAAPRSAGLRVLRRTGAGIRSARPIGTLNPRTSCASLLRRGAGMGTHTVAVCSHLRVSCARLLRRCDAGMGTHTVAVCNQRLWASSSSTTAANHVWSIVSVKEGRFEGWAPA